MYEKKCILWTTIGRKILLALSGLALFFFLIFHLLGNLTLFMKNPDIFNQYARTLENMGILLYIAEGILILTFLVHIVDAILVTLENRKARSMPYYKEADAGKPSHKSLASKTMIYTGILVLIFMILHIKMFKFASSPACCGSKERNLYLIVSQAFTDPTIVAGYCLALIVLGFHLRHAFFSAFQSLGISHPRYTPYLDKLGIFLAFLIAGGFLSIPIWFFIR